MTRGELERPPFVQAESEAARGEEGDEHGGEPRLEAARQRERHRRTRCRNCRAAYFIPTSVSAAGYAHCAGTPASASVRDASVRPGTEQSSARTIQRASVSSPCSSTRRRSSGSCRKPLRKPVAQITCSAPFSSGSTRKRPSRAARSIGSSHSRPGGYDGAQKVRRSSRALPGGVARKRGEAALREERPRHVQRPAERLAAADRDDLGAGGKRVPPLGRRGHAGADHGDRRGVLVRLVGVDDPRVGLELRREREPWMPRREQNVPEGAVTVDGEAAPSTPDALDPGRGGSSRPSRCAPAARRRGGGTRRRWGGSGCRRSGASGARSRRRAASRAASPGNVVGKQWPSLSERMRSWRIAAARTRQAAAGSASSPKTAISAGSRPPWRSVA